MEAASPSRIGAGWTARRRVLSIPAMRDETHAPLDLLPPSPPARSRYEAPGFEWISLACEISAYAPDADLPLF
jgi:hypothetical protein